MQERLSEYGNVKTRAGQRAVVHNGHLPARPMLTLIVAAWAQRLAPGRRCAAMPAGDHRPQTRWQSQEGHHRQRALRESNESVTNRGTMRWKIFDGALNADILIDFMKRLVREAARKVYLILDNLRVHHSKPVKAWLAQHKEQIEVFYLPSYRPELNPDEIANADLKQAVTKLAPARTKLQRLKPATRYLRSVQRQPEHIKRYFEHELVRYAA